MDLKLVLKHCWYDMIEAGHKPEEYRAIKESIVSKLFHWQNSSFTKEEFTNHLHTVPSSLIYHYAKKFKTVTFYRGYTSTKLTVEFKGLSIGEAVPEWSGNWKGKVFIIKLGNRVECNHYFHSFRILKDLVVVNFATKKRFYKIIK